MGIADDALPEDDLALDEDVEDVEQGAPDLSDDIAERDPGLDAAEQHDALDGPRRPPKRKRGPKTQAQ